ncbi:polysaccharide deacetylase family protein [Nocardia higoensis]|uniref:Polysaccharide deacetylase family protein n=1 Tax=Nocardia higoensis TaxID=228599 RepID=A0ABS0DH10_9NOCA|nr:polysaccharide deacetylase family protein [Nocardia higoensis]MBF6357425.1 polysaccharide deacetylase family protein [Nocardia higoensis]
MRQRMWLVVASVVSILLVVGIGGYQLVSARSFQLAGELVDRAETDERVIALTLDDGPSNRTPEVLRVLDDLDVPATFYLNGRDVDAGPEHTRAIMAAGHELGNHTYTHRRMLFVSPGTVREEVEKTDAALRGIGYQGPITFRPPYGKKLWTLPRYLAEHNRTTVMWDVEPDSGVTATADAIADQAVREAGPGSIILLHVMYGNAVESLAAIPRIVEDLRAQGYRFVTVSGLLNS